MKSNLAGKDWFEFKLVNDSRFLKRIEQARISIRAGRGIAWEQIREGAVDYKAGRKRKLPKKSSMQKRYA